MALAKTDYTWDQNWYVYPRRRNVGAGALMHRHDGIEAIFSAPAKTVAKAQANAVFPNVQSNPAAATPIYDGGAQVGALNSTYNISTPTFLKTAPGYLFTLIVVTAGSATGAVYDYGGSGPPPGAATEIMSIPNTAGPIKLDWPCQQGIYIVPGIGQVLSAKWA